MPAYKTFASYAEKLEKALVLIEEGKVKQAVTQIKKVQASAEKRGQKAKDSKKPAGQKRPLNKYMEFLAEHREQFKKENPNVPPQQVTAKLAAMYNKVKDTWEPSGKKKPAAKKATTKKAADAKKASDAKKPRGRPKKV